MHQLQQQQQQQQQEQPQREQPQREQRPVAALDVAAGSRFGGYMAERTAKLLRQDAERVTDESSIFAGLRIHINGHMGNCGMNQLDLKRLILRHGGIYQHYFSRTNATHMIATMLPLAKTAELAGFPVVRPEWLLDCAAQLKLLPWRDYALNPHAKSAGNLKEYYENSRLHYLSTWKTELQEMVKALQGSMRERHMAGLPGDGDSGFKRVVMHIDMDCFFASASLLSRPELVDAPVGVSHNTNASGSSGADIASCNYVARTHGVKNGMLVRSALEKCPGLVLLPYDFELYKRISQQMYNVVIKYAEEISAVSCDEVFIDATSAVAEKMGCSTLEAASLRLAQEIRIQVYGSTRCCASIGIGENMLLARLATRQAKPNNAFALSRNKFLDTLEKYDVRDLPGVGRTTAKKLHEMSVSNCAELATISKSVLCQALGPKSGETIYSMVRGIDERTFEAKERRSVSVDKNYGIRFTRESEMRDLLRSLSNEVSQRLEKAGYFCQQITLSVMKRATENESIKFMGHGICTTHSKSAKLYLATRDSANILAAAENLLTELNILACDLRGMGLSCTRLSSAENSVAVVVPQRKQHSIADFFSSRMNDGMKISRKQSTPPKQLSNDTTIRTESPVKIRQEFKAPMTRVQFSALKGSGRAGAKKVAAAARDKKAAASATISSMFGAKTNALVPHRDANIASRVQIVLKYHYDMDVFNSLPTEIQKEIYDTFVKELPIRERNMREKIAAAKRRAIAKLKRKERARRRREIANEAIWLPISDLRSQLLAWTRFLQSNSTHYSLSDFSQREDVRNLLQLISDIITRAKNGAKARQMLLHLQLLAHRHPDLSRVFEYVINETQKIFLEEYHGPAALHF